MRSNIAFAEGLLWVSGKQRHEGVFAQAPRHISTNSSETSAGACRRNGALSLSGSAFGMLATLLTMLVIIATSLFAGIAYHSFAFGRTGNLTDFAAIGTLAALAYVAPQLFRNEIWPHSGFHHRSHWQTIFSSWNTAMIAVIVVGLLTKTTANYSRATFVLFYVLGFAGLLAAQRIIAALYRYGLAILHVAPRRVMLVGTAPELAEWERFNNGNSPTFEIVERARLPRPEEEQENFAQALYNHAARAREMLLDDVVLLTPLSQPAQIERCIEAFSLLPVAIHVCAGSLLSRFTVLSTTRIGKATTLLLTRAPMSPFAALTKRSGDLIGATLGLIILAPLFLLIALIIKLDSKGPIFFRQRRLGYNQKEFLIYKFRTMTTTDDGDKIIQAKHNDDRITRVGAWLRASNIDELPQLFNVLKGEMSIVGPRPHAVAHDRDFEKRILRYPRRLNVRPGITGWAQVHGLRGETETDDKMAQRVEHDLYYIDHWSFALDAYILLLTLFSTRAYRNAR